MDLEAVVDELYGLPAADFTGRRDELAQQARAEKDAALGKEIRALRKPTAAAALVNRLARDAADVLDDYLDLGERLRAAQSRLAGDQLRALGQERQRAAAGLVKRAVALADGGVSAAVQQEVDATLFAAVADPAAAQAVASGRLTRGLSYAGLGEVDISAATATPLTSRPRPVPEPAPPPEVEPAPEPGPKDQGPAAEPQAEPEAEPVAEPEPAPRRPARDGAAVLAERRERADAELDDAAAQVREAREAAELAAAAAREALATQRDAEQEVDDLRERLAQARFAVRQAQQDVASAQAARQAAERAVTAAEKAYGKSKHRRDLLGED